MQAAKNLKYHGELGKYFASKALFSNEAEQKGPNVRKVVEQPWQMTRAEMWDEVTDTLCNLDFIQAKTCAKLTYDLVKDLNDVLAVIPDSVENIRIEKERQARMQKYTQDLIAYAKGEIKVLDVPQSITPWSEERIKAEIERIKTNPNKADILRDFANFMGQEADNLQGYCSNVPNLAYQQAYNFCSEGLVGKAAVKIHSLDKSLCFFKSEPYRPDYNPLPQMLKTLRGHSETVSSVSITRMGRWQFPHPMINPVSSGTLRKER